MPATKRESSADSAARFPGAEAEEHARRSGFAPVTSEAVMSALARSPTPVTASEIAELLPRDHRGRKRSEYLVSWVLDDLVRIGAVRRAPNPAGLTYVDCDDRPPTDREVR